MCTDKSFEVSGTLSDCNSPTKSLKVPQLVLDISVIIMKLVGTFIS